MSFWLEGLISRVTTSRSVRSDCCASTLPHNIEETWLWGKFSNSETTFWVVSFQVEVSVIYMEKRVTQIFGEQRATCSRHYISSPIFQIFLSFPSHRRIVLPCSHEFGYGNVTVVQWNMRSDPRRMHLSTTANYPFSCLVTTTDVPKCWIRCQPTLQRKHENIYCSKPLRIWNC